MPSRLEKLKRKAKTDPSPDSISRSKEEINRTKARYSQEDSSWVFADGVDGKRRGFDQKSDGKLEQISDQKTGSGTVWVEGFGQIVSID